jgi:hypothetical protein
MGLRFTSDENVTALFDSVSGWAFGPTFDSSEDAEEFLRWCETQGIPGGDVRSVSLQRLAELETAYCEREADDE